MQGVSRLGISPTPDVVLARETRTLTGKAKKHPVPTAVKHSYCNPTSFVTATSVVENVGHWVRGVITAPSISVLQLPSHCAIV